MTAYLFDDGVGVVEEGDGDGGAGGDGQAQQEDGSVQVLLQPRIIIVHGNWEFSEIDQKIGKSIDR